jgi:hypothetical protein
MNDELISVYCESFENAHPQGEKFHLPLSPMSQGRAACCLDWIELSLKQVHFLTLVFAFFGKFFA